MRHAAAVTIGVVLAVASVLGTAALVNVILVVTITALIQRLRSARIRSARIRSVVR